MVFRQPEPVIYCRDAKLLTSLAPIPKRCPSSWFLIDFPLTGQNSYLGNMTSAAQGKSSKGGSPSQAALAGLRLPAELHVVSGATQRATGTTSGSTPQPKVRDYRQQASNQSSPYLNPSSYGVPNNQIYQVGFFLQIYMLCNFHDTLIRLFLIFRRLPSLFNCCKDMDLRCRSYRQMCPRTSRQVLAQLIN